MNRREKEVLDQEEIEKIFNKASVIRIAICDGDIPYIVPMNFGKQGDHLYLHSSNEGKKIDLLRKNSNVGFEIDTDTEIITDEIACRWSMKYCSIVGYGKAEFLQTFDEKAKGLNVIMKKYSGKEWEFSEGSVKNLEVIKIRIDELTCKKSR